MSAEAKCEALRSFQEVHELCYPVVLKPDLGERGQGVAIIKTEAAAAEYLKQCQDDIIAQEFVPGSEFGVFYYRYPDQDKGEILSITHKQLVSVVGNGRDNLEHLILHDSRALRMAKFFLRQHADHLEDIPTDGQNVYLSELGTHCRGALFTDAREHITDALRDAIDDLSQQFDGFHFGRYDLRVPSVEELRAGRNLKVLELNGVTSEATHIYNPGYSLIQAWKDICNQWRIAFEIGMANIARDHQPSEINELLRLGCQFRKRERFEASNTE